MRMDSVSKNSSALRIVLVTILVGVVIVAVVNDNNKRQAEAMKWNGIMYAEEARVTSQEVVPILNYVPGEMARYVKPDLGGYVHVMSCGHDQDGRLFWYELNGGLAGVVNQTKAVVLRFYDAITGQWVESVAIQGRAVRSVSQNLEANMVLNGGVPESYRRSAWRDFNFGGSSGATDVLGFGCNPEYYAKGTFAAGSVYFACNNSRGLHINKVGARAPWNRICTWNTPLWRKKTLVLLFYKTLAC